MVVDLSSLNPAQREAVEYRGGPLLVLAGAGSGKTRVVTMRIAHLIEEGVPPSAVLAVTFTNKAAREMRERLAGLVGRTVAKGVTVATFHSFGALMLRSEITRLGYRPRFSILDQGDQVAMVRRIIKELKADPRRYAPDAVLGEISLARSQGTPAGQLLRAGAPLKVLAGRTLPLYEQARRAHNAVDFDDLLMLPIRLLTQHADLKQAYRRRYRHLLVDEYQDTNRQQLDLVSLLAGGERPNLVAVGDDDQSIYAWRGARAANILEFERHFPGTHVVALEQNYRSTQQILETANQVIAHNATRRAKRLRTERVGDAVRLWACRNEEEEAKRVVVDIRHHMVEAGRRPSAFGVLYRTNAQARAFEVQLQQAHIPYQVIGGTRFFDRKEVRDALAYLRLMHDPYNEVALLRAINTPPRGIGAASLRRLGEWANEHTVGLWTACCRVHEVEGLDRRAKDGVASFAALIRAFRTRFAGRTDGELLRELLEAAKVYADIRSNAGNTARQVDQRLDHLRGLQKDLDAWTSEERGTLEDFLVACTLDTTRPEKEGAQRDEVTLMTLHGAKGLEFDVVYLVGLEEGLLPFRRQGEEPDVEEERRLCYVGITRARDLLVLTRAESRSRGNDRMRRVPSRFLAEMHDVLAVPAGAPVASAPATEDERYEQAAAMFARIRQALNKPKR